MSKEDFVLGLIAGEGSFWIELNKRTDMKHNIFVRPAFGLSVRYDDPEVVNIVEEVLGFGEVRQKNRKGRNDLVEIRIRKQSEVEELFKWVEQNSTPVFERTAKFEQYSNWKEIYKKYKEADSKEDVVEIVKDAKTLSDSNQGKSIDDWIQVVEG